MNREIKFRALNMIDKWEYGSLITLTESSSGFTHFIIPNYVNNEEDIKHEYSAVNPKTVGEFTGLKDKNGVKIYEGDILKWNDFEWGDPANELVEWDYGLLDMRENDWSNWCEVIGNIHENPELLQK